MNRDSGKKSSIAIRYAMALLEKMFPGQPRFRKRRVSKYGRSAQGEACRKKAKALGVENLGEKVTRQQIRSALRRECFRDISARFSGEMRHIRRKLGLALARNRYKAQTTGVSLA